MNGFLKWVKREKVNKEDGHVVYVDLYRDIATGVEYWGYGNSLVMRVEADGRPFIEH